jgi:hypothetical protein
VPAAALRRVSISRRPLSNTEAKQAVELQLRVLVANRRLYRIFLRTPREVASWALV